jgi:hypothetical protein
LCDTAWAKNGCGSHSTARPQYLQIADDFFAEMGNSDLVQCSKTGYSITSAVGHSSVGGTVRPSAFAVLRLMA